jgi:hypothetical protein
MPLGIDFDGIAEKNMNKICAYFNLDGNEIYSPRFRRFIKFFGYKFLPFVLNIAGFIIMIMIFQRILKASGIETLFIVVSVIIIFSLGDISAKLKKLVE